MSVKIDRLNHAFVRELSYILLNEVKDDDIRFVTITGCDISSDLSYAKVYYTVLNTERKKDTDIALDRAKSFIRGKLSERVDIRHTPELKFIFDDSIEYGNRIEQKLQEIKNKENDL